ncbi:antitoxin [Leucothrix pacifica]|uniref:AbrB family transcriptional regulator n=1 Tax=Leucothrix pacifica TaxID=1247513 RepID=A0A317CEF7_9GAMM|nr:type II toxin-antitoxin system VapB family antitoxin [Leucothrix pacifica]PWQ96481.1 AbrB family transcriptional regulator [Leucothrix pacifica]
MGQIAKLFMNGRSQAVRLPVDFRFDCEEVYIRRDEKTGDIILSKHPDSWDAFFDLLDDCEVPDDFLSDRDNDAPQERDVF